MIAQTRWSLICPFLLHRMLPQWHHGEGIRNSGIKSPRNMPYTLEPSFAKLVRTKAVLQFNGSLFSLVAAFTRGELTTSQMEAPKARRSCAPTLETFTQSFLHRAKPKTRGPERGSRPALIEARTSLLHLSHCQMLPAVFLATCPSRAARLSAPGFGNSLFSSHPLVYVMFSRSSH